MQRWRLPGGPQSRGSGRRDGQGGGGSADLDAQLLQLGVLDIHDEGLVPDLHPAAGNGVSTGGAQGGEAPRGAAGCVHAIANRSSREGRRAARLNGAIRGPAGRSGWTEPMRTSGVYSLPPTAGPAHSGHCSYREPT
jgi:hypothetical protein